jgi:hypothetical protein
MQTAIHCRTDNVPSGCKPGSRSNRILRFDCTCRSIRRTLQPVECICTCQHDGHTPIGPSRTKYLHISELRQYYQ